MTAPDNDPTHPLASLPGATTSPEDNDAVRELLTLFELEAEAGRPDRYVGQPLDLGLRNLFGGHILGQSLMAAGMTCGDRHAHSLHAYFLRAGDATRPICYDVERLRDGHSFSVRRVTASQGDKPILILSTSFQIPERGFEHQRVMPDVPAPETLSPFKPVVRSPHRPATPPDEPLASAARAIEMRPVPSPRPGEPAQCAWLRAVGTLPDGAALHKSLLAYASDFGLLPTSMRLHGVGLEDPDMVVASLDHAMWFYRDFRMDDWLLYVMDSPTAGGGRGLNYGSLFRRDGTLVACVAQEGLIRRNG